MAPALRTVLRLCVLRIVCVRVYASLNRWVTTMTLQDPMTATPNHALQRTPGFGVQLPGAALIRPAQSRAVLPAMKPGTARAFALRRRAHSRAPGPESLSLGSLGDFL